MEFEEAPEPTDIIWENRRFTRLDYFKRELMAFILVAILIGISFWIMYVISLYAKNMTDVFPVMEC